MEGRWRRCISSILFIYIYSMTNIDIIRKITISIYIIADTLLGFLLFTFGVVWIVFQFRHTHFATVRCQFGHDELSELAKYEQIKMKGKKFNKFMIEDIINSDKYE